MTEALRVGTPPRPLQTALLALVAALLTVLVASSLGNPNHLSNYILLLVGGGALITWILNFPFHGYLAMCGTVFFLMVYAVTPDRYLNGADMVLPTLGLVSWFGVARRRAGAEDDRLLGTEHGPLIKLTRDLMRAGIVFFGLVFLSIAWLTINVGRAQGLIMVMFVARSLEGAAMLPLGVWWLRSEKRIHQAFAAVCVAFAVFTVVNLHQVFEMGTYRAGITWLFNYPQWPVECSNEAGFTMIAVYALILARHHARPSIWTYPALGVVLFMEFLTQSRSGLIGMIVFNLLSLRFIRWDFLVALGAMVPLALRFVPSNFFDRMARSATWERGTFEVYSILIRVYGYQSGIQVFLENWLFGVGFFGLMYVSQDYNDLGIGRLGAENIFLETATGMGIIGLASLCWFLWLVIKAGLLVKRACPPGTLGHAFGRFHLPYVLGTLATAMSSDSLIGTVGLGQLLFWTTMAIRAGHVTIEEQRMAAARVNA